MTTDKALEILGMSGQARWSEGYEKEDVEEAIETIKKALQSKPSTKVIGTKIIELVNDKGQAGTYYYDETRLLIFTGAMTREYAERRGFIVKTPNEGVSE